MCVLRQSLAIYLFFFRTLTTVCSLLLAAFNVLEQRVFECVNAICVTEHDKFHSIELIRTKTSQTYEWFDI